MLNLDINRAKKIKPELRHFSDFDVLYLYVTDDDGVVIKLTLYLDADSPVPFQLLHLLGPAIENARSF